MSILKLLAFHAKFLLYTRLCLGYVSTLLVSTKYTYTLKRI